MGESVQAVTLPGSTKLSTGAPALGAATITVGAASWLVVWASTLSACLRFQMPKPARAARTMSTNATPTRAFRGEMGFFSGAVSCSLPGWGAGCGFELDSLFIKEFLRNLVKLVKSSGRCGAVGQLVTAFQPAVDQGEEGGHKEERGHGGQQQSADDGAAEGGFLFAAFAQAQGHGRHAEDHGQRGHQHRAEADEAGAERGPARIAHQDFQLLAGKADYKNRIGRGQIGRASCRER